MLWTPSFYGTEALSSRTEVQWKENKFKMDRATVPTWWTFSVGFPFIIFLLEGGKSCSPGSRDRFIVLVTFTTRERVLGAMGRKMAVCPSIYIRRGRKRVAHDGLKAQEEEEEEAYSLFSSFFPFGF